MHKADLYHSNPALQEKLEKIFLLRRTKSAVNWDQENFLDLLQHFGNPHKRLPPVIHVAGTNGKGSIVAMLRAICEAAGMRVHAYTSPHLIHVNERIFLAGRQIDDDRLEALIDEAMDYIGDRPLSFFEVISAVAFKAFSETPADILLLEAGMGGRLDCTNIITAPLVSIISRVSMDHMQFLGQTIEEIAAQKAGIMKKGVPCIIGGQGAGEQGKAVIEVMQQHAQQTGTPLIIYGQDFSVSTNQQNDRQMIFKDGCDGGEHVYPLPSLLGEHQIQNAGSVIAALRQAKGLDISDEAIPKGLQSCQWPGRLQRISDLWPGGAKNHEIWLDCGHNDSAGEALAVQIERWNKAEERPTFLVVGMLGSKDSKGFIEPLQSHIFETYVVPVSNDATSQTIEQFQKALGDGARIKQQESFVVAIQEIMDTAKIPVRVLIAGSIYLAGEVLQFVAASESR